MEKRENEHTCGVLKKERERNKRKKKSSTRGLDSAIYRLKQYIWTVRYLSTGRETCLNHTFTFMPIWPREAKGWMETSEMMVMEAERWTAVNGGMKEWIRRKRIQLSPVHTKNDKDISVHTSKLHHLFIRSARASAALNSRARYSRMDSDCVFIVH